MKPVTFLTTIVSLAIALGFMAGCSRDEGEPPIAGADSVQVESVSEPTSQSPVPTSCSDTAAMAVVARDFVSELADVDVSGIRSRVTEKYRWISIQGPGGWSETSANGDKEWRGPSAVSYGPKTLRDELTSWKREAGKLDFQLTGVTFSPKEPGDNSRGLGFQGGGPGTADSDLRFLGKAEIVCRTGKIWVWSMGLTYAGNAPPPYGCKSDRARIVEGVRICPTRG